MPSLHVKKGNIKMKVTIWVSSILFFLALVAFAILHLGDLQPKLVSQVKLPRFAPGEPVMAQPVGGPCAEPKCVVIFLAPWCPKCRESADSITALQRSLSAEGVPIDIVIGDDSKAAVLAFAERFTVPVLLDFHSELFKGISLPGTPYLAVINPEGVVINDLAGFVSDTETLKRALNL